MKWKNTEDTLRKNRLLNYKKILKQFMQKTYFT